MIKRILLTSLLLFMPLFAHADALIFGEDIRERNIPFKLDIMEKAFKSAFSDVKNYETIRGNFYSAVYNGPLPMPFSMQDLHEVCQNSVPKLAKKTNLSRCADLVRMYIDEIKGYYEKNDDTKKVNNEVGTEKFIKTLREYNESQYGVNDSIIPIIKDHLANGVDVDVPVYEDGHTALMIAIDKRNDDLVRVLLDAKANVNAITESGKTALYIAVGSENLKVTDLLLQAGADPNIRLRDEMQPTVLFMALDVKNIDIVKSLINFGADKNVVNVKHETPCDFLLHTCGGWADFYYADDLLCPGTNLSDVPASNANQRIKTCEEKDPDDMYFTSCCIAQDEGKVEWDPYRQVCVCPGESQKWNPIYGTCDDEENYSCKERYPGDMEALSCCYLEKKGETFWNDITGECICSDANKKWKWNFSEGKCLDAQEYRKIINNKYADDLREPWQEYQVHEPIAPKM